MLYANRNNVNIERVKGAFSNILSLQGGNSNYRKGSFSLVWTILPTEPHLFQSSLLLYRLLMTCQRPLPPHPTYVLTRDGSGYPGPRGPRRQFQTPGLKTDPGAPWYMEEKEKKILILYKWINLNRSLMNDLEL